MPVLCAGLLQLAITQEQVYSSERRSALKGGVPTRRLQAAALRARRVVENASSADVLGRRAGKC